MEGAAERGILTVLVVLSGLAGREHRAWWDVLGHPPGVGGRHLEEATGERGCPKILCWALSTGSPPPLHFLLPVPVCAQLCPSLCDPTDCSSPGSSVHGILQARILEGLPCPPPGHLPDPRTEPSPLHCRQILYHSVESIACHVDPTPEGSFMYMWAHKSSTLGSSPWESCCGPFPKSLLLLKHPILLPELFPSLILSGLQGRPQASPPLWSLPALAVFRAIIPVPINGRVMGLLPVRPSGPPNSSFSAWNFPRVSVRMDSRCPRPGSPGQILHCSRWRMQTPRCLK